MSVLAIDAGTTGVTAIVVTAAGDIVARGHHELARHLPRPGWVEHSPEEIWQATLGATRTALQLIDTTDLEGVGITNQRGTVVLWDRDTLGSPRPAIGWQDRRTTDICTRLRDAGHGDRVTELTGLGLDPCFSGTTLAWIAENEPHTWALVESERYAIGTLDSYLIARMTRGLHHVTDVSNASRTLLLDLAAGDWSDELCGLLGVPREALPDLVPSWGEVAVTDPRTFLGLELPIAGIAGDRQAALFGQTCLGVGDSSYTCSAAESMLSNSGTTIVRSDAGLLPTAAWRSSSGELTYALEAGVIGTGTAELRAMLRAVPGRPGSVRVLRVDGDRASDDLLCQQLADQLGLAIERPGLVETAALGAAFMAGLGVGVWSSAEDLREVRQPDRTFIPSTAAPSPSS